VTFEDMLIEGRRQACLFFVVAGLGLAAGLGASGAAAAEPQLPEGVAERLTPAGTYLTDTDGMSLYLFLRDSEPGVSSCVDACAEVWPPLQAPAEAAPVGHWRVIERPDGGFQWAYRDMPVYSYSKDSYPGGAFGDNVGNAWRVLFDPIDTPPGIVVRSTALGRMLTDFEGRSLYVQDGVLAGSSGMCVGNCLHTWVPRPAPAMAREFGDWSVLVRSDGVRQWAFRGQPLYAYAQDFRPGDLAGNAVDGWLAAVLDPAPPVPDWVTIQFSDMGQVFADAAGMTLYVFVGDLARSQQLFCDAECTARNWTPVMAVASATPVGDWAPVQTGNGDWQWAYKGDPVYTHTRDREPGAIGGDKWATGAGFAGRWDPLVRSFAATDTP